MKSVFTSVLAIMLLQSCKNPSGETKTAVKPLADSITVYNDSFKPARNSKTEEQIKKDSLRRVNEVFPYVTKYPFKSYKAEIYKGELKAPDFTGSPFANDKEYVAFITKGCKRDINFGGKYTIIEKSCGAMCSFLFMVDRESGKIINNPTGLVTVNGYYGFAYTKDSYLLITNATVLIDASNDEMDEISKQINPEIFLWSEMRFKRLK